MTPALPNLTVVDVIRDLPAAAVVALGAVALLQIIVTIWALTVLVRTPSSRLHFDSKLPWLLIILLISPVGPIVFLAAARRPVPVGDPGGFGTPGAEGAPGVTSVQRTIDDLYGGQRR